MFEKLLRKLALVFMDVIWAVFSVYVSFYVILGPHMKTGAFEGDGAMQFWPHSCPHFLLPLPSS